MTRLIWIVIGLIVWPYVGRSADSTWEKTGESKGVVTYRKEIVGSPTIAFRGEGEIAAPFKLVSTVLLDCDRMIEWVRNGSCKVIKRINDYEYYILTHLEMPPLFTDREFVLHSKIKLDAEKGLIHIVMDSVEIPEVPLNRFIRGQLHGEYVLQAREGGKATFVEAEMHGDPKGALPKWLVNWIQKMWPVETFSSLKKQVVKPDLAVLPKVNELLGDRFNP